MITAVFRLISDAGVWPQRTTSSGTGWTQNFRQRLGKSRQEQVSLNITCVICYIQLHLNTWILHGLFCMCLLSPLNICLHGGPKASIVSGARFHLEKAKNSFEQITNIHTVSTTVFINENCFLTTLAVDRVLVRMRNATNGLITEASGHIAVPLITSNETYIVRKKKQEKNCSLAALSFHQKCYERLNMSEIYFRPPGRSRRTVKIWFDNLWNKDCQVCSLCVPDWWERARFRCPTCCDLLALRSTFHSATPIRDL